MTQGNSPDEEYVDPHGECMAEIGRLSRDLSAAKARIERLEKMLRPILQRLGTAERGKPDTLVWLISTTLGDLRAARRELENANG